jgi:hypothetical protein
MSESNCLQDKKKLVLISLTLDQERELGDESTKNHMKTTRRMCKS